MRNELPVVGTKRNVTDLFLMLVLLCVFSVSALVIVITGARVYQDISRDLQTSSDLRIPLSYLTNKIHQGDGSGGVHLIQREGTNVLVLSTVEDTIAYDTLIYAFEGQLYEVTVAKGADLRLADGTAVMPVHHLELQQDGPQMLHLTVGDASGQAFSTRVALRSHQGAPDRAPDSAAINSTGAPEDNPSSQEVPIL